MRHMKRELPSSIKDLIKSLAMDCVRDPVSQEEYERLFTTFVKNCFTDQTQARLASWTSQGHWTYNNPETGEREPVEIVQAPISCIVRRSNGELLQVDSRKLDTQEMLDVMARQREETSR